MIRMTCSGGMPVLVSAGDITKVRALGAGGCEVQLRGCCEPFAVKESFDAISLALEAKGRKADGYMGAVRID